MNNKSRDSGLTDFIFTNWDKKSRETLNTVMWKWRLEKMVDWATESNEQLEKLYGKEEQP